ncbi:phage tail protein [Phaeobacter sp. 11ANDIMAR09]|uniref:phage tail-collar fiber domain-containing protein n=1 Tax=Phaeobacter sp. 11ANDIMAR09 TaxID=1225647 RepID=UPI0006C88C26|nr:phage tail protein [Phaeobacter sp. 11ANDIMAR09]KPD11560.1 transposase [Phaeobacter sp. 11ANDIMAR09]
MPTTLLTDTAEAKITAAAGSGTAVAITHIALGDGNGGNYAPSYSQTALQRELARQAIQTRHIVGSNAWRVKAEFDPDTPAFAVREMGFFDADGDLIAIWAGNDVVPRQTGAITYLVDHVLSFTRVDEGLVIVNAPDDVVFDLAVTTGTAIANLQLEQLRQADAIRLAEGTFFI